MRWSAAHGPRVIARVARNPSCTSAQLEELATLTGLLTDADPHVAESAAANPRLPVSAMNALVRSTPSVPASPNDLLDGGK